MRGARQVNPKGGSFTDLAVNRHGPAGLPGKPVHHAQAEASSLVHFLGRKEGLKGTTAHLLAHASSSVSHGNHYVIIWIERGKSAASSASDIPGRNRQFSPRQHSISRIDREIEDSKLQLARLGHRRPGVLFKNRRDRDCRPNRTREHFACFGDELVDVDRLSREFLMAREGQKLIRQLSTTLRGAYRVFQIFQDAFV